MDEDPIKLSLMDCVQAFDIVVIAMDVFVDLGYRNAHGVHEDTGIPLVALLF